MRKYTWVIAIFAALFFIPLILHANGLNPWQNLPRDANGDLKVTCRNTPAPTDKWVHGVFRDTSGNVVITNCGALIPTPTPKPTATPTPTPAPSTTPAPTPTPTPANPGTHVKTVAYGWGYNGISTNVSIASQSPWLTYAYETPTYNSNYQSAGIKTIYYTNFWFCYASDNPRICWFELAPLATCQADASTYGYSASSCTAKYTSQTAKNCSGGYIYDSNYGGGYENGPYISQANFDSLAHDRTYADGNIVENYVFSDDTATTDGQQPCNYSGTYNASEWVTQSQAINNTLTTSVVGAPMFVNLINAYVNSLTPVQLTPVADSTNVVGAMCENCYVKEGGTIDSFSNWQNDENACLQVISYGKLCWVYANLGSHTLSTDAAQRIYAYASFLLSFNNPFSMFEYSITGLTSNMPVMPEEELVPINPIQSPTVVSDLATGGGYFRQWQDCFYDGTDIGGCAVAVNPNSSGNMAVPITGYANSLAITDTSATSDIVDGGVVSLTGTPTATLGPQSAEILFSQ